jgi:predicted peptidase
MDKPAASLLLSCLMALASCAAPARGFRVEALESFAGPSVDAAFLSFHARGRGFEDIPFRLRLPADLDPGLLLARRSEPIPESARDRPFIVYLNGSGVSGRDNSRQLSPPEAMDLFLSKEMSNAIILVPQCPYDTSWDSVAWPSSTKPKFVQAPTKPMRTLIALVKRIESRYPVDKGRAAIMGFSLGAFGALETVIREPGLFSKAVPMGGGTDTEAISRARGLSFRIYHGEADNNVSVIMARDIAQALEALGADYRYIEIPDANHDVRSTAFRDPELRAWLLSANRERLSE